MNQLIPASEKLRRRRLFSDDEYSPWVRAHQLEDCFLFHAPVSAYPCMEREKLWFCEFYDRLSLALQKYDLRAETFLRYKGVEQFGDTFQTYAQKCQLRIGIGRITGKDLPRMPSQEEIQKYIENPNNFDYKDWIAEYLYWFVTKQPEVQRRYFLGHGQLLTLFLPPDPAAPAPRVPQFTPALRNSLSVFRTMDVDGLIKGAVSARDSFQQASKVLFGKGIEDRPDYPGIRFVLPLLDSGDFFAASPELKTQWFSLFDVYVRESDRDQGVLLAFQKEEYATLLVGVLDDMRSNGWNPGGRAR